MESPDLSRREFLAGAAAAAALASSSKAAAQGRAWTRTLDFRALDDGRGWPGWTCAGVANLRRESGRGLLEAGSDVFPCDPRPVAFALDRRFVDGAVHAELVAGGAGAGV
ncbi:MAG: twin-arginine translocation signal domain-containing protein, partial [Solirubrobacterales bacterium]